MAGWTSRSAGAEPLAERGRELLGPDRDEAPRLPNPSPTTSAGATCADDTRRGYRATDGPVALRGTRSAAQRRWRRGAAGISRAGAAAAPDRYIDAGPDQRGEAERSMQEVNEAWRVLSDPGRRRRYDAELDPVTTARARWATDDERFATRPDGTMPEQIEPLEPTERVIRGPAVDHPHRRPVRHLRVHRVRRDRQSRDDTAGPGRRRLRDGGRRADGAISVMRDAGCACRRRAGRHHANRAPTAPSGCSRRRVRSPTAWRSDDEGGRHRPCRAHGAGRRGDRGVVSGRTRARGAATRGVAARRGAVRLPPRESDDV